MSFFVSQVSVLKMQLMILLFCTTNIKTNCISKVVFFQMFDIAQQDSYDSLVSQQSLREESTHAYRHMDGDTKHSGEQNHVEQTLSMVASGVVGNQNSMLDVSSITNLPAC